MIINHGYHSFGLFRVVVVDFLLYAEDLLHECFGLDLGDVGSEVPGITMQFLLFPFVPGSAAANSATDSDGAASASSIF